MVYVENDVVMIEVRKVKVGLEVFDVTNKSWKQLRREGFRPHMYTMSNCYLVPLSLARVFEGMLGFKMSKADMAKGRTSWKVILKVCFR